MADLSNSDKLKQEKESFTNIRMPLPGGKGEDTDELPFIVGAIDAYSGNADRALKKRGELSKRKFDKVSRYTLDTKIAEIEPGLDYEVKCTLPNTDEKSLQIKLDFRRMKDFTPKEVAERVPQLNKFLRLREQLVALKSRASARPETRKELEKLIAELMAITNPK